MVGGFSALELSNWALVVAVVTHGAACLGATGEDHLTKAP